MGTAKIVWNTEMFLLFQATAAFNEAANCNSAYIWMIYSFQAE